MDNGCEETLWRATEALARAWNRLDFDLLGPWLADDVRYDSLDTDLVIHGKLQVLGYLRRKAELIELVGESARVRAELGRVETAPGRARPCVISSQGALARAAVFLVTVVPEGLIARIEVCTSDPDPVTAHATGVRPD